MEHGICIRLWAPNYHSLVYSKSNFQTDLLNVLKLIAEINQSSEDDTCFIFCDLRVSEDLELGGFLGWRSHQEHSSSRAGTELTPGSSLLSGHERLQGTSLDTPFPWLFILREKSKSLMSSQILPCTRWCHCPATHLDRALGPLFLVKVWVREAVV